MLFSENSGTDHPSPGVNITDENWTDRFCNSSNRISTDAVCNTTVPLYRDQWCLQATPSSKHLHAFNKTVPRSVVLIKIKNICKKYSH